jgi:hypothetical protein
MNTRTSPEYKIVIARSVIGVGGLLPLREAAWLKLLSFLKLVRAFPVNTKARALCPGEASRPKNRIFK